MQFIFTQRDFNSYFYLFLYFKYASIFNLVNFFRVFILKDYILIDLYQTKGINLKILKKNLFGIFKISFKFIIEFVDGLSH